MSEAWKEAKPPPKTPEEAARLVIQTLKRHQKADVEVLIENTIFSIRLVGVHSAYHIGRGLMQNDRSYFSLQGLLAFYGLPHPHALAQVTAGAPTSLPQGVKFELQTLPVNYCNNP